MTLTLPFPLSVNAIWRSVNGRTILSSAGRKYRQSVAAAVRQQQSVSFGSERLQVLIELYEPDRRRRDLDNACKALLDGLQAANVFDDDSQVDVLAIVRRGVDRQNPRAMVTIEVAQAMEAAA